MKISLATKIFIAFTLLLLVFGAVSIYGVVQLAAVRDHLNVLNRGLLPLYQEVVEMRNPSKNDPAIDRQCSAIERYESRSRPVG